MARRAATLRETARRLGHDFARPALLDEALTHGSLATPGEPDNQRLEFLGDRVLNLVIAEALTARNPAAPEGVLAPQLNALVRKEACAEVAAALGLGDAIRMGRSEMLTGGRRKTALLGDAMEAVIAAVFLDAGFAAARDVVLRHWGERLDRAGADAGDPKSDLQVWAQGRGLALPLYREVARAGPDHEPRFTVEVSLATGASALAEAGSKRAAEREAAARLLAQIGAAGD
jgi:ribonuclease-3